MTDDRDGDGLTLLNFPAQDETKINLVVQICSDLSQ